MNKKPMTPDRKHPDFVVRQEQPLNGGPPLELLARSFVTPRDLFFLRTHGTTPQVDPAAYRLKLAGLVDQALRFSLADLAAMPQRELTATIQCAGNRRDGMIAVAPIVDETPWGAEAISTAVWRGVALHDLLHSAGWQPGARHVAFVGLDEVVKCGEDVGFGGSIPLAKALDGDVLLALEMNGEPLSPDHGFPVRVVVPGYIGARSVKWLAAIQVQSMPSENYFQSRAYKLPLARATCDSAQEDGFMLGETSVNAAICEPAEGAVVPAGMLALHGYATAGGSRCVERVDVSADAGETWQMAQLLDQQGSGVWCRWRAELELVPGTHRLAVRAWDSAANTQPESARAIWNFKGYMNNAWHCISIQAQ